MTDPKNQFSSEILSQKEIRRYTKQLNNPEIGLIGQEKLKGSKILVIGAGGKGTSILQNLITIGIGKLGIADNSFIVESDLSRQHLFGNNDLGKHKAIVTKQKLQDLNHLINYEVHNVLIEEKNAEILCENYDLLIDATDNFEAHSLLSEIALKLNKPLIYTSVTDYSGQIAVFNYKNRITFNNLLPEKTKTNKESESVFHSATSVIEIIGAIAANETIKIILGINTPLNVNLLIFSANKYSSNLIPIS